MAGEVVTIANGATDSSAFNFGGFEHMAIHFPTMTGTTVTFKAAQKEGGTFVAVSDQDGTSIDITAADNEVCGITGTDAEAIRALGWMKIVSASAEGAARELVVYMQ